MGYENIEVYLKRIAEALERANPKEESEDKDDAPEPVKPSEELKGKVTDDDKGYDEEKKP